VKVPATVADAIERRPISSTTSAVSMSSASMSTWLSACTVSSYRCSSPAGGQGPPYDASPNELGRTVAPGGTLAAANDDTDGSIPVTSQCTNGRPSAPVASTSTNTTASSTVPSGTPVQLSGGDASAPSHVYDTSMALPSDHGASTPNGAGATAVVAAAAVSSGVAGATVELVVVVGRGSVAGRNVLPSPVSHAANPTALAMATSATSANDVPGARGMAQERTDSLAPVFDGMPDRPVLLTVHAHPDDEASKGAATVAKYHAAGVGTVLVCCTGGEEGDLQNPSLRDPGQPFHGLTPEEEKAKLAELRPGELAASAAIIGFDEVVMLGYRDSGMPDSEANGHAGNFHNAPIDDATGALVEVIRRTRPQVILTYGDDQRGYPHPDHLRVHDISVLAFDRAGDPDWYPSAGEPFQPSKLYYTAWSRRRLLAIHEALIRLRGASPFDESWLERPDMDHRITTKIDISEFLWARTGALRAHATQVDPNEAWWFGLDDDELAATYPWEEWILARSLVGPIPEGDDERDLFAGITAAARS
jgi:mycothiol S-conjugate amidase